MSEMPRRFPGKVALVTGAGGAIGGQSALRLAREGAFVAVADVRLDAAEKTVSLLEAEGHEALALECDVRDEASVGQMVAACIERFGRIDLLHNNAGVLIPGTALTQRLEDWDLHFAVNVRGVLLVSRAVIPHMQRQGGGAIVNTGSTASLVGEPNCVSYDSTKGAVLQLTRQMAIDFAKDGIRVNCVCPGGSNRLQRPDLRSGGHDRPGDRRRGQAGDPDEPTGNRGRRRALGRVPVLGRRLLHHRDVARDRRRLRGAVTGRGLDRGGGRQRAARADGRRHARPVRVIIVLRGRRHVRLRVCCWRAFAGRRAGRSYRRRAGGRSQHDVPRPPPERRRVEPGRPGRPPGHSGSWLAARATGRRGGVSATDGLRPLPDRRSGRGFR